MVIVGEKWGIEWGIRGNIEYGCRVEDWKVDENNRERNGNDSEKGMGMRWK